MVSGGFWVFKASRNHLLGGTGRDHIPAPPSWGLVLGGSFNGFLVHETNKTTPELGGPSIEIVKNKS